MINGSYIYIPAKDLVKSSEWYEEFLELKVYKKDPLYFEMRNEGGNVRVMLIPTDTCIHSHMHFPNGNQASYGFTVSNVEVLYHSLKSKGIKVGELSRYDGISFGFNDLDGNVIEFWEEL